MSVVLAQVIPFPNRGYDPLLTKREVAERLRHLRPTAVLDVMGARL